VAVATGGTIPQVTPPKAESQRDAACEFCLSAGQAGSSIAKFGLKTFCGVKIDSEGLPGKIQRTIFPRRQ